MSTSTLYGYVNTIPEQAVGGRGRRRLHSDAFKANAGASCMRPGTSVATLAMVNCVNANLLRRRVRATKMRSGAWLTAAPPNALTAPARQVAKTPATFIPMQLPTGTAAPDIRIELRRGSWPTGAATGYLGATRAPTAGRVEPTGSCRRPAAGHHVADLQIQTAVTLNRSQRSSTAEA